MVNFYEVLGLQPHATAMDVEKAIRIARQRGEVDEKLLTQARNCLLDPNMRKVYDKKMGIRATGRPRSALKSDTPFWIPVFIIVGILLASSTGIYYVRKDAKEKQQHAEQIQHQQSIQARERAADGGGNEPQVQARVKDWYPTQFSGFGSGQHMIASKQVQTSGSVYKELKLVLSVPAGEQAKLSLVADTPIVCEGECRIQLDFDQYTQFSLPSSALGEGVSAPISASGLAAFAKEGQVLVTMPDQDHTQFVFDFKPLPIQ